MVNYQVLDSFLEKRRKQGIKPGYVMPEDTDIAIGGVRELKATMLLFDIAQSTKFRDKDFIDYVSPFIHTAFHIANTENGMVNEYTGDGALVSFCGKEITEEDACGYAVTTAVEISDLAHKLQSKYSFPTINVRIGIDFGKIQVERIGVRGKTQLILAGSPATTAKRLETLGKEVDFDMNSTILFGYDVYHNLSEKRKSISELITPKDRSLAEYFNNYASFYTKKRPYLVYKYNGRYRE